MELVASARLRRAQARIEAMRPCATRMLELMVGTARAAASVHGLPLLQRREEHTVAMLPLTGTAAVLRQARSTRRSSGTPSLDRSLRADGKTAAPLVAGKKGNSTWRFRGHELTQAWSGFSDRRPTPTRR